MDRQTSHRDHSSRLDAPVCPELLFEATEALIRALWSEDPAIGVERAVDRALRSEIMAPFDAPESIQAALFLRRLGYLSPQSVREA